LDVLSWIAFCFGRAPVVVRNRHVLGITAEILKADLYISARMPFEVYGTIWENENFPRTEKRAIL